MTSRYDNQNNYNERTPILSGEETSCSSGSISCRCVLAILGCVGFMNVYAMRVNLSVALVAMVHKPHDTTNDLDPEIACVELLHVDSSNTTYQNVPADFKGEFDWDTNTQAIVLGSFFYGYVITQIPGGIIAEKFGAKWLFGIGVLVTAVFTLLTPVAARWNVWALVVARAIEGLGEGVTFPAMNALVGRWIPKMERSRMATVIYMGCPIGTVIALLTSGLLSDSQFLGGWPSVFYVFGTCGCLWFIFWIALVYESPEEHPRITKEELRVIRLGQEERRPNVNIPWKSILTSVPVWALVVTHFSQNWGFYTLLTELPTYLANVLHFNIKKNGVLSAFPYLSQAIFAIIASVVADRLRKTGRLRITSIRKIMNSVAFFSPAICIISIIFVGCQPVTILALLTLSMGLNGFMYSGFNITHVDMSPEFAGTLMGITNCIANFAGFLAPAFVGKVIEDGQTLDRWSIVFITTSAVYFVSAIIYNIFGSAELQPWGTTASLESRQSSQRRNNSNNQPHVLVHQNSNF